MREGDYPDGAYFWHDVGYALSVLEEDGEQTRPGEAVIEPALGYVAYLTVRAFPYPERVGEDTPPEQSIYIDFEQGEALRDWLDRQLQEWKATHG